MLVRDVVMMRRIEDPLGEYRELILYQDHDTSSAHSVWECTGFLHHEEGNFVSRTKIAFGFETQMRQSFAKRRQELLDERFAICESEYVLPALDPAL